jgi:hydroxymethylpyrimidine pyrophosphatase-like HAD family hydrolase
MLAVFDLDGTLLDGDSTALWLWDRVRRSVPRLLAKGCQVDSLRRDHLQH